MSAVTMLGYTERMEYWMFELQDNISRNMEMAEELMEELRKELIYQEKAQELDYVKEEYDHIIRFVEKNQELVRCKAAAPKRGPSINTKMSSRWAHQEEVDRLKRLREEGTREQFDSELEKSYREGKLYLPELEAVRRYDDEMK